MAVQENSVLVEFEPVLLERLMLLRDHARANGEEFQWKRRLSVDAEVVETFQVYWWARHGWRIC